MKTSLLKLSILIINCTLLTSCSRLSLMVFIKPPVKFQTEKVPPAPDYSDHNNWHKPHLRGEDKTTDVFYVHPTTYITGKGWNQALDDEHVNWRTRVLPLNYQAATFYKDCRMFIPKYRQAIFYSFVDKKENGKKALEVAYQDVRKAFYYYIEHLNEGRPFILAAHSQGSYHSQRLLAEVLQDSLIKSKLIVAYVLGWPIKEHYVKESLPIGVCSTATQTGCLVSWNTESGNPKLSLVEKIGEGEPIVCVNPLSWNLDTTYVSKTENLGALQPNKKTKIDEIILDYCDAKIENDALKITPPANQSTLQMPMGKGNYHLYDYSFFFQNIRENARDRIQAYEQSKRHSEAQSRLNLQE
ncbi:DUF3089 domain-containing protein [Aureispira sp. CCB-QB1]|uniref:DUF3089 domain-containing protein n=1 Tax=Aureispira sp. CCB-QB1 TaxID=1313421 RepID=UPI000698C55B|nr:DUF3089 domain-containing protein [Aureispira sp. CCB-QB1]